MKRYLLLLALLSGVTMSAFGFALVGPYESWQDPTIGYNLVGDFGGPKDLGDQYRWNIPVIYYTYDPSFLNFFGVNGEAAIDSSFAVYNNLKNLSSYSSNLTEFPLNSSRYNQAAAGLGLLDMKSANMAQIAGFLGLNHPTRYIWTIHDRFLSPNTSCPTGENYIVVQRNFDPATTVYSSYVNGVLIDYQILETCVAPNPLAITVNFAVDPFKGQYTAVADQNDYEFGDVFAPGLYYNGLTRDDIGGLRYLMSTNRIVNEDPTGGSLEVITNSQAEQLLTTSNYGVFYQQALTNGPAALLALYPQLIILSTNFLYFSNVITANTNYYLTNRPNAPAGTLWQVSNVTYTATLVPIYQYSFGNVQTNNISTTTTQSVQTIVLGRPPNSSAYAPYTLITNAPVTSTIQQPSGDYFFMLSNACGNYTLNLNDPNVVLQHISTTVATTNIVFPDTNGITTNSGNTLVAIQTITYYTSNTYAYRPIDCIANTNTVLEGIDHMKFVRVDYDPLLSTTWVPVTNTYQLTAVTANNQPQVQTYYRVVNQPDIVVMASDTIIGPAVVAPIAVFTQNYLNFITPHRSADTNGPGNIIPSVAFVYGKGGGPIYENNGFFAKQANGTNYYNWGSFDGTTNAPVLYPSSASLAALVNQVFFQILTTNTPVYHLNSGYTSGNPYKVQLVATGGTAPYTFSIVPNTPALPSGLTLSTNGVISGYGVSSSYSGTTYDFQVQATDAGARVTQTGLYISIKP